MKYNTITKQVAATVPGGIYETIDYHGEPPADVAARAGWVDVTPEIQLLIDAEQAEQDAAQAKADEEARKAAEAEEDKRIMALPSIAAIVAENADLRKKLDAAEAKLATVQATADKAATDIAALKETPKTVEPVPK
jgi:hypothetical protein